MELDADSEVWNVPLMPGWPPALGLEPAKLAGWGLLWQFFKNGKNLSKERLFLHFNYQGRLAQDRKRGCAHRRTTGIFASTSCKSNILLGMHFGVPAKRNMNDRFQSAKQCGMLDAPANRTLQVFLLNI